MKVNQCVEPRFFFNLRKWMGSARRNKFFVFQGVLSPNLDHVLERFDDGLRKLASQANNAVAKWLSGLRRLQGIVITDFSIYDYPNFSRSVFSMNWKQPWSKTRQTITAIKNPTNTIVAHPWVLIHNIIRSSTICVSNKEKACQSDLTQNRMSWQR